VSRNRRSFLFTWRIFSKLQGNEIITFYFGYCIPPGSLQGGSSLSRSLKTVFDYPEKEKIKVLSYNIKFSLDVPTAIKELQTIENLRDADIVLLQEMNEEGTILIAETLGYNYVYYPIVFYTKHDRNFGNAVLSKYPILENKKIIFPNKSSGNGTRRAATSTLIKIGEKKVRAISAHLATIMLPKKQKLEQIDSLLRYNARDQLDYQIVGGDYNTLTGEEADYVIKAYQEKNFDWASQKVGPTGTYVGGFLKPWNDHIFTKGFKILDAGKAENITASDHFPIWVELVFDD